MQQLMALTAQMVMNHRHQMVVTQRINPMAFRQAMVGMLHPMVQHRMVEAQAATINDLGTKIHFGDILHTRSDRNQGEHIPLARRPGHSTSTWEVRRVRMMIDKGPPSSLNQGELLRKAGITKIVTSESRRFNVSQSSNSKRASFHFGTRLLILRRGSSADLCVNGLHSHMARLSYVQCRRMSSDFNATSLMVGCSQREESSVQHLLSR